MGPPLNARQGGFRSSIRASARRVTNSISPVKQDDLYHLAEKALPSSSTDRSSTSSRSSRRTLYLSRRAASSSVSLSYGPDVNICSPLTARHQASASITSPIQESQTFDSLSPHPSRPVTASASFPYADVHYSSGSMTMASASFTNEARPSTGKPGTSQSNNVSFGHGSNSVPLPPPSVPQTLASGSTHNPHTVFQHIQDMSSKRISTLDYLRKA
ncbi:MAG: hypothetical protein LQ343_006302 [Gyalolechia ehrenbergii]|nr:MAG: hypothetical protein LQ343_006302 [Gyalolechia ehrenbergii]